MDMNQVYDALVALGPVPGEVATKLLEEGCQGSRSSICSCPVAKFVLKLTGARDVIARSRLITIFFADGRKEYVEPPHPVQALMTLFDIGGFQELVA